MKIEKQHQGDLSSVNSVFSLKNNKSYGEFRRESHRTYSSEYTEDTEEIIKKISLVACFFVFTFIFTIFNIVTTYSYYNNNNSW